MESTLNFVTKFTEVVKEHMQETTEHLGKEVIDSTAKRTGICVDKIKVAYGAKFSMLGHNYKDSEMKQLEEFDEDILVCQGGNGFFFVPVSNVKALGQSLILVESDLNQPEMKSMGRRKQEVYKRFFDTKRAIKEVLPKVEEPRRRAQRKKRKLRLFY